ncbi:hypothetical protein G6F37_004766 [Rhizopus arrhizus]|nr:hypothetical protein G6F38_010543 [Rhizopus arrhizus]KAG1159571.1 hypothetical protein G6F37_004766 [Rhizopus arrhizus]
MSSNPHSEKARQALSELKQLSSTTDGWNFTQEKEGVKLYNKTVDGNPIPIVRGDIVLEGDYTVQQALTVCTLPGCRKIWDDKFDASEVKAWYSRYETLFWTKLKAPWPISPRDIAGTSLREFSEDEGYIVMTSVTDPAVPVISGNVRANLIVSGWKVTKTSTGVISLIYITQIDLAGSLPLSFLKSVQQQVPLCARKVVDYIKDHGYPPLLVSSTAQFKEESFDHAKRLYEVHLEGEGEARWSISGKMYPGGFRAELVGTGTCEAVSVHELVVKGISGPVTVKILKK